MTYQPHQSEDATLKFNTNGHRVTEVEENKPLTYEHGLGLIASLAAVAFAIVCVAVIAFSSAPKG